MNTYKPSQATPRGNIPELERYIFRELNRISASMDTLNNPITTLYAEPERPAEGEFQIADGALWNPGSGFGLYQYLAGSWVLISGQGGNSDIVPVSEVVSLTDGQTTVVFTTYSTQYSGFYLSGIDVDSGRLQASDYTIVSDTTIELAISYPANTTITLLRNASEGSGPGGGGSGCVPVSEVVSLTDGQMTVVFSTYSTEYAGFYINGSDVDSGRLQASDYNVVSNTTITLSQSYPANTTITLLRNASEGSGVDATAYDDTAIQAEVDLNTAKVTNVDHPLVETSVPTGALFTDTVYTLPFTDNSANWNTAYGWGDHSSTYLPLTGGTLTNNITSPAFLTTNGVKYDAISISNNAGTKLHAAFIDGGSTVLHYDGSARVTTGASGINIAGSIAATGAFNAGTAVNLVNASTDASISARCATASYKLQAVGAHLTLLYLQDTAGVNGRIAILAKREGRVALYYDNVAKFETTNTGAKVTGVLEGTVAPTAASHLTRKDYVDNAVASVSAGGAVVPVMLECLYRAPLLIAGNAAHNGTNKVAYSAPSVGGTPSWLTLSSDGYTITLSEDGIYELSHNTFIASTSGQRSSVSAKFALGGVVQSVRPATGYIRLGGNHNESSTHIVNYLVERSGSNLLLTVPLGNETSNGAVNATMAAGESTLTIKKIT